MPFFYCTVALFHPSNTSPGALFTSPQWAGLIGTFVDYLGLGTIFPLIPYFVNEQDAHVVWLGAIISCQYIGVTIGSQYFGNLCDRLGPKKVMMIVLFMDVLLFFFTGISPNVYAMVAFRFFAGFFTPMPVSRPVGGKMPTRMTLRSLSHGTTRHGTARQVGTAWIGICVPDDQKAKAFHKNTLALLSGFISGTALGALAADLFYACVVCRFHGSRGVWHCVVAFGTV